MRIKHKDPRQKRKVRIRKNTYGTTEVPRVAIFKSNKNIYAQAINDIEGNTII